MEPHVIVVPQDTIEISLSCQPVSELGATPDGLGTLLLGWLGCRRPVSQGAGLLFLTRSVCPAPDRFRVSIRRWWF